MPNRITKVQLLPSAPNLANTMLVAAFISLVMSNVILEVKLPDYSVKHIEKIRVLFAVNEDTKETESFVPMSQYLEF
jgi:hypothetical protein